MSVRARRWLVLSGMVASVALIAPAPPARAHELSPALLSLVETARADPAAAGMVEYEVTWRVPTASALTEMPLPVLPPQAQRLSGETRAREGDATVHRFRVRLPGGLAGKRLSVRFGAGAGSEVLVRIGSADGRTITGRIVPGDPDRASFLVPAAPTTLGVASTYLKLGVEHILSGIDHLAFVLGLLLLTPVWGKLWRTVTAFTVAHSLTLALAALGVVRVPQAPVEAAIALSIVLVAREAWLLAREAAGPASDWARPATGCGRGGWRSPSGRCTAWVSPGRCPRWACPRPTSPWRCCPSTSGSNWASWRSWRRRWWFGRCWGR